MAKQRESYDVFAIPRNFGEDGMSFNGMNRRNLIEGAALGLAVGYPIIKFLPFALATRIIICCFIALPLAFLGIVAWGAKTSASLPSPL